MKHEIVYEVRLYASYYIEADDERKALDTANELLDNDLFRETRLIGDLDDPWQWGDALADCKVSAEVADESSELTLDPSRYLGR